MRWAAKLLYRLFPPNLTVPEAQLRGAWAEDLALRHLRAQGLHLLARNYRCPNGEIDLILRQDEVLVFVEVRFRGHKDYGGALESVDIRKQQRVLRCAERFLQKHKRAARRMPCRFDIVAVEGEAGGQARLNWLADAFRPMSG